MIQQRLLERGKWPSLTSNDTVDFSSYMPGHHFHSAVTKLGRESHHSLSLYIWWPALPLHCPKPPFALAYSEHHSHDVLRRGLIVTKIC